MSPFRPSAFILAALVSYGASAQTGKDTPAPVFLTSAEVRAELVDKVWIGTRGVYGAMTQVNYKADRTIEVLYVDTSVSRKGKWELDERGQMCVTWTASTAPLCYVYSRAGAKLLAYELPDRIKPHAELQRKRSAG
ncbi:hypothetical protein BH09PSE5_BH09PSE5_02630 [soil metagenome]